MPRIGGNPTSQRAVRRTPTHMHQRSGENVAVHTVPGTHRELLGRPEAGGAQSIDCSCYTAPFLHRPHPHSDGGRPCNCPRRPVRDPVAPLNGDETSRSDSWAGEVTPSASYIDLSHVLQSFREPLRGILTRNDSMWDGRLGEINIVKHRIYLAPGTRPHIPRPFLTGSASRKFVRN